MRAPSERHGAVWNKLMSFHSDMSAVGHKYMDSHENELYAMVSDSIKAGGAGVSIGRNVFNREDSLEVIERLRKIVFD